jgi:hypothetical protein
MTLARLGLRMFAISYDLCHNGAEATLFSNQNQSPDMQFAVRSGCLLSEISANGEECLENLFMVEINKFAKEIVP